MKSKILFLVSLVLLPITGCDFDYVSSSESSLSSLSTTSVPGGFTFAGNKFLLDSYDDIASIEIERPGYIEEWQNAYITEIEPIIDNQYYENMIYSFKFVFKDINNEELFINFTRDNFTYDSEHVEVYTYYEKYYYIQDDGYYGSWLTPVMMLTNHSFYISMKKPINYTEVKFEAGDISFIIPISILEVSYDTNQIYFSPTSYEEAVDCCGYCFENFSGHKAFIKIVDNYEDYTGTEKTEQFFINYSLLYVYAGTTVFNNPTFDVAFISYNNRLNINFLTGFDEYDTNYVRFYTIDIHYLFVFSVPKQYLELPVSINHIPNFENRETRPR